MTDEVAPGSDFYWNNYPRTPTKDLGGAPSRSASTPDRKSIDGHLRLEQPGETSSGTPTTSPHRVGVNGRDSRLHPDIISGK